ncbi:DUF167 domain-containing protein [Candidatus Bathyarchaeota archaeon]|nr:MAG: DUF167 domain-containing protein [Candidatus Bathyarchaeota archaeon]
MLIRVYVTAEAKPARLVKISEDYFEARVDERAVGGRANKRLPEILAEHFKVPKSRISIVRGAKSRDKTVQVSLGHTADLLLLS